MKSGALIPPSAVFAANQPPSAESPMTAFLKGSALIGKIRGSALSNLRDALKSGKARTLA